MIGRSRALDFVLVLASCVACQPGTSGQTQSAVSPTSTPPPVTAAVVVSTPTVPSSPTPIPGTSLVVAEASLGQKTELSYFRADDPWINISVPAGTTGAANLIIDKEDGLWLGNDGGVSAFIYRDPQTRPFWITYTTADGLPANKISALAVDQRGQLWAATPNGAAVFDGTAWTTHDSSTGLPAGAVSDIAVGPDGSLWASTGSRLYHFDGQRWIATAGALLPASPIVVDNDANVWAFTTPNNISRFDGRDWTEQENFLPGPLELLEIAPNGHVWAGSGQFGAALSTYDCSQRGLRDRFFARFDGQNWEEVTLNTWENSIPGCGPAYAPLSFGRDGHPWIGYRQFVANTRRDLNTRGLAGEIQTVVADSHQRTWFGTSQGLAIPAADIFEPAQRNVRVIYHDARRYDPAGIPIYQQGTRPWLDLLVQQDDHWYGPERSDDELQVQPLNEGVYKWLANGGFSTLPNGEAWWNGPETEGLAILIGPNNTPIYTVPLQIKIGGTAGDE